MVILAHGAVRVTVVREVKGVRKAKLYGRRKWFTLPDEAQVYSESQRTRA